LFTLFQSFAVILIQRDVKQKNTGLVLRKYPINYEYLRFYRYYDETTETTESAKQDEAELKLRQYLSHIYNGVNCFCCVFVVVVVVVVV
jgi:hypothetical protein